MRTPIFPYLSIVDPADLQSEDKVIANEREQKEQRRSDVVTALTQKVKNTTGLNLSRKPVDLEDDPDLSFYELTYRVNATMHHVDGSVYPIRTNLEFASSDLDPSLDTLEITSNWLPVSIEDKPKSKGYKRLVCNRHDGLIVFDYVIKA